MKLTVNSHLVWVLVAVSAFAAGYSVSGPSSGSPRESKPINSVAAFSPDSGTEASLREHSGGSKAEFVPLDPEQVSSRTYEVLSSTNRIARMRQFCELLERVSRENWREAADAFMLQTTAQFRLNPEEWNLLLERIGEVAGGEALGSLMDSAKRNDQERIRPILSAWAAADPKAAAAWVDSQPPEKQTKLLEPLLSGMARTNPKEALSLAIGHPQEVQEGIIPNIVDAAVQKGGFAEGEALLAPLLGRADIEDGTRGKVFSKLAHRRISIGKITDDPFEALAWFDNYVGNGSPAGPIATTQLMANAANKDPEAAMAWLQERVERMSAFQAELMFPVAAQAWQGKAPEQFIAWAEEHRDHPYRDSLMPALVTSLLQAKRPDEARSMASSIRDPKIRGRAEKALQQFEAASRQQQR